MQKAYNRQNFHNGTDPALDEVDMNKIDQGLDVVDDRVIALNQLKADKTEVLGCIAGMTYSISTGILKITSINGAIQTLNLGLNNVALSMSPLGVITMEDSEGNTYTCDLREILNSKLSELSDVDADIPTDGQILVYNASTQKWEAADNDGGTAVSYEAQTLTDSQKAQARENIGSASVEELSHENLLDNPFFTVNERNATTVSSTGYVADRWVRVNGTATYSSNGIEVNDGAVIQIIEQLPNGTYTLSVKLSDGTIKHGAFTKTDDTSSYTAFTDTEITIGYMASSRRIYFATESQHTTKIFKAIKLEVGSASTLALDLPRPYAEELARCQTNTADAPADTYANKGNLVTSNSIAPTEDGATASKAYAVGEHFFRGGNYCTCISAIASGGTFTLNTNYKVEPLSDYLTRKEVAVTVNTTNVTAGTVSVHRCGKIVEVALMDVFFATTTADQIVATGLPQAEFGQGILSYQSTIKGMVLIGNNGTTLLACPTEANSSCYCEFTYIAKD